MKGPIVQADAKQPPYQPVLRQVEDPLDRLAWDQNGLMWVWTPVRRRAYVCSRGVEHKTYWRTRWEQGRTDYVACEHEVEVREWAG